MAQQKNCRKKLSLLVPCIPGRPERIKAILSRFTLSVLRWNQKYPEYKLDEKEDVEIVIVDGGSVDHTKNMCLSVGEHYGLKYIWMPIGKFVNANYPRNLGLRLCQGEVIIHLDVDHYPSESIVEGAYGPFVFNKVDKHINRGYVIDSSKSPLGKGPNVEWLNECNEFLLKENNLRAQISSVYKTTQIPEPGRNNTLWIWATKRKHITNLHGYDESYCRKNAYGRDEDCWRQRMLKNGLHMWDGANKQFCAIHLWHSGSHRQNKENEFNKRYFNKQHGQGIIDVAYAQSRSKMLTANLNWPWGRFLKDGFSIIDGVYRGPKDHENWISNNIDDIISYEEYPFWDNIDHYWEEIDKYVRNNNKDLF